jgi:ribosomal protein S18
MPPRLLHPDEYELIGRDSNGSNESFDLDEADFQSQGLTSQSYLTQPRSLSSWLLSRVNTFRSRSVTVSNQHQRKRSRAIRRPRKLGFHKSCSRLCSYFLVFTVIISSLLILTAIFRPSYSKPPSHYQSLRQRVESSREFGRANPENQKIFIAASIYDAGGYLLGGAWGDAVLELISMLGRKNVYLSIYETTAGDTAQTAQLEFEPKVQCSHTVVLEDPPALDDLIQVVLPDGHKRTKRIAYLAEARNRALQPLEEQSDVTYDKLLYLNDVAFDPIEAAQLLLSTNLDEHGQTAYRAACAVDFINPFKFYDTYATRDLEGYRMGLPFFPWFSNSGQGSSRADVLAGKDAVRVKSCWGGMVAFDARPFQATPPLRFRATEDTYWDASECCLIHADIIKKGTFGEDTGHLGIYMNPFVRVAYDSSTLAWLSTVQRFERLFSVPHNVINHLVGLPWLNPRRTEEVGAKVEENVWITDNTLKEGGSYQTRIREAQGDGYCGMKMLQVMKETPRNGEKHWEALPVPPG